MIVAIIPARNEERTIADVVFRTRPHVDSVAVITDSNTRDRTVKEAKSAGAIAIETTVAGKGAALLAGFQYGLDMNADFVVTIDGDGQYDPASIPLILKDLPESRFLLVNGSRLLNQNNIKLFPISRYLGNILVANACSYSLGIKISDGLSGLRAYSHYLFKSYKEITQGFGSDLELLFEGCIHGCEFIERPIPYQYGEIHRTIPLTMLIEVTRTLSSYLLRTKGHLDQTHLYFKDLLERFYSRETFESNPPSNILIVKEKLRFGFDQPSQSYEISLQQA